MLLEIFVHRGRGFQMFFEGRKGLRTLRTFRQFTKVICCRAGSENRDRSGVVAQMVREIFKHALADQIAEGPHVCGGLPLGRMKLLPSVLQHFGKLDPARLSAKWIHRQRDSIV